MINLNSLFILFMSKRYLLLSVPLTAMLMLSSCMDDSYDLSNIDTTVEVKVNDLVIPVNLGPVRLNSIIDLGDDPDASFTKETVDGKDIYVYNYKGDFKSDDIEINSINVVSPGQLDPNVIKVDLDIPSIPVPSRKKIAGLEEFHYKINELKTEFTYNLKDIDNSILSVDNIDISSLSFTIDLNIPSSVMADSKDVELKDILLEFPKGMTFDGTPAKSNIGSYDPSTGLLSIPSYKSTSGQVKLTLTANELNFKAMGIALVNHALDFDGHITVKEGEFILTPKDNITSFPNSFDVDINYFLSSFNIKNFTGKINYTIDGLQFEDAALTDIPDFLNQEDTKIKLGNPQIYLSINNSCADYKLEGITKLQITPIRDDQEQSTLEMNNNMVVGYDKGEGPYLFAISPEGDKLNPIAEYQNAEKLLFSDLGDVLYGNGLPQKLRIGFDSPRVSGDAQQLPLGTKLNKIQGNYMFRAPLALADGSQIVYSGTENDWNSEELEDLYVNYLEVTAIVNSDVPLNVKLAAEILNTKGERLGVCEATELPANAKDFPITIKITPDAGQEYISDIDGIYYEAWAISSADPQNPTATPALSPDQTLKLDKIRAKVNGKYIHRDKNDD